MIPAHLLHQYCLTFATPDQPASQRTPPEVYAKIPHSLSAMLLTEQYLWLGSDESCTLERFSQDAAGNFGNHQHYLLTDYLDLPGGNDHEIDIEGLDYQAPYLWIVGSHSYKRKKLKPGKPDDSGKHKPENLLQQFSEISREANRYLLARIPIIDGQPHRAYPPEAPTLTAACLKITGKGNALTKALRQDAHLGPYVATQIPGKENGLDIEGIALLPGSDPDSPRLVLGLRGPVLRGLAVLIELDLQLSPKGMLKLNSSKADGHKSRYRKYFIDLDGLGIRDILVRDQNMLILAGPTMDLDGPVRLYRLPGGITALSEQGVGKPDYLIDLPHGQKYDHAEGITFADQLTNRPALLVAYDAPSSQRCLSGPTRVLVDLFALP